VAGRESYSAGMRIIGIDPGLNVTGIGIIDVDGGDCRHVHHCVVRTRPADGVAERLGAIMEGVQAVASEWEATDSAIEASFVGKNAKTALALGQARAAAILGLRGAGLNVAEYAPTMVKRAVAGYGRGEKSQIAEMVRLQLGLKTTPKPLDASDALAVAITHWAHARIEARL
jgi:crossover junction endodeoxyribonuclease RuvC